MHEMCRELPLAFDGHVARIVAKADDDGGWHVCTEVDGRQMGNEHFPAWCLVEQFRARMQRWLSQAEIAERESSGHLEPTETRRHATLH
jgi:hypothetical protein